MDALHSLLQLSASKATLDPPQQCSLRTLLRGYPQWKELPLPVLKHQLGSLRLGAIRGERRHRQLVIAALWGFLLQRRREGRKIQGRRRRKKKQGCLVFEVEDEWEKNGEKGKIEGVWRNVLTSMDVWAYRHIDRQSVFSPLNRLRYLSSTGGEMHSWQTWWKIALSKFIFNTWV